VSDHKLKPKKTCYWLKYLLIIRNVVIKNLKKLIFVNKNWPNYLKIGCKFSSNLVESYILKLQCLSVCLSGQCLKIFSSHCPFPVMCFVQRGGARVS